MYGKQSSELNIDIQSVQQFSYEDELRAEEYAPPDNLSPRSAAKYVKHALKKAAKERKALKKAKKQAKKKDKAGNEYLGLKWQSVKLQYVYSITHRLKSKRSFSINTRIHFQSRQMKRRQRRRKSKNQRKNQKISPEKQKVGENVDAEEEKLLTSRQLMMKIQI